MIGTETVVTLLTKKGLAIVAPIAVVEGPIVTVIAAWLASRGIIEFWPLAAVVITADLVGDLIFYALGRYGIKRLPRRWRARLGLHGSRLHSLVAHFEEKGGRTLVFGKVTHSAGAAILVAAGVAKMPFAQFVLFNLLATIPKSFVFLVLGYSLGAAYARIDDWIARGSLIVFGALLTGVLLIAIKRMMK